MKKLTLAIAATLILTAATANASSMVDPFKRTDTSCAFGSTHSVNPIIAAGRTMHPAHSPICFGRTSSFTGQPRTEYVSPHFRSNGTLVEGHFRSRR